MAKKNLNFLVCLITACMLPLAFCQLKPYDCLIDQYENSTYEEQKKCLQSIQGYMLEPKKNIQRNFSTFDSDLNFFVILQFYRSNCDIHFKNFFIECLSVSEKDFAFLDEYIRHCDTEIKELYETVVEEGPKTCYIDCLPTKSFEYCALCLELIPEVQTKEDSFTNCKLRNHIKHDQTNSKLKILKFLTTILPKRLIQ